MTPEKFLAVADWLPDVLMVVTKDGRVAAANRAACRLLGRPVAAVTGQLLTDFVTDDAANVQQFVLDSARARQQRPGAMTLAPASGDPIRCRISGGLLWPAVEDRPALVMLRVQPQEATPSEFRILTDRAEELAREVHRRIVAEEERKKIESQMLQTQKLESLGVLAGGIAHDFNNLLTGVIGYMDLARLELPASSPAHTMLEEAVNGARRAAELTQQMLAYSGKGRFVVGPVVLSALVTEITRLLEVSISKKCVLRYDLMADLPPCKGDATQLRQIVMNLIINASEAIGERSGVITVTTGAAWCDRAYLTETYLNDGLDEGLYVHLEVADTGHGMSPETRARIFDPFFSTKFTGRGLGLAAVLGIVRGHGGAIRVYSEEGRGTTFKVLLPAVASAEASTAAAPVATDTWRATGSVLVVDDEESIRALARVMLERLGFRVHLASDGREGVERFRELADENPLVLLDMTMPHLDGAGAFRELRRIRPDVRAILMSGYNELSVASQFAGKGLAAFIQKPYRFDELQRVVRSALEGAELPSVMSAD